MALNTLTPAVRNPALAAAQPGSSTPPAPSPVPASSPAPAGPAVSPPQIQKAGVSLPAGDENAFEGAAAGAVNGLLFGIPEFAIKRLGGKQWADDFIAKHKTSYTVGNVAGAIGSTFIPIAGPLGKLLQGAGIAGKGLAAANAGKAALGIADAAKLAGAAGEAANIGRAALPAAEGAARLALPAAEGVANVAAKAAPASEKLLSLVGKGALAGGAEGAVRGVTGSEQGQELQGGIEGLQSGAAFGALGGGVAGTLAKAAPRIASAAKKYTEKSVMGTTDAKARGLLAMVDQMSGAGSGPGAKLANSDKLRGDFVNFIKENKLWKEGAVEDIYEKQKEVWGKLDDVFDKQFGNKKVSEVLEGALSPEDTTYLLGKYSQDTLKKAQADILDRAGQSSGMANIREKLRAISRQARSLNKGDLGDAEYAEALHDVASTLRSNLDAAVVKAAEDGGAVIPPTFKRDWGFLQPLEKGTLRADWTPTAGGMGSPTFEKAMMGTMLGTGGVGGFMSGDSNTDIGTRLANTALGSLGGLALSKGIGKAGVKAGALLDTAAGKLAPLAPGIAKNATKAAVLGGGLGSLAANGKPAEQDAATVATAAKEGSPEHTEDFNKRLVDGMNREWLTRTMGMLGPPDPSNPEYTDFVQSVTHALTDNGQSPGINPKLAANILFADPTQRADYLKALEATERVKGAFDTAAPAMGKFSKAGLPFVGDPQATSAKGALIDAVKALGGDPKATEGSVNRILNSGKTKEQKIKAIMDMLKVNNPEAMNALSLAGKA